MAHGRKIGAWRPPFENSHQALIFRPRAITETRQEERRLYRYPKTLTWLLELHTIASLKNTIAFPLKRNILKPTSFVMYQI